MQLVLDTNEYLFALGSPKKHSCEILLEKIAASSELYQVRICRTIVNEIRKNSIPQRFKDFWVFLGALGVTVDEDWEIPFEIVSRYESTGFKPADAFIAGYTEYVGAQYFITENRADFLDRTHLLPFKALNAATFLKVMD